MHPLALLGLAAGAGLAYSAGYEVRAFTLRRVTVPVLPAGSAPVRVLHLSDLHLTPGQRRKQEWLRSLAQLDAALVIVTGDFWAHRDALAPLLDALAPHLSKPGAFVFGSNDYYAPTLKNPARYLLPDRGKRIHGEALPWQELRAALVTAGWSDLTHQRTSLKLHGLSVEMRGVDDAHLERDDYSLVQGARGDASLSIGVTHAPYLRVLDGMAADGLDLVFAGHTHGGQLRLPGFGALVTNCDLDRQRARGLHRHGQAWLHVSAGCGTSPYTPLRFACRPEASLLTLVAKT